MSPPVAAPFLVAGWLVDPRANELARDGATHRLEPKVMDVLVALAERPGEPVTREALLERVWPGVFVTESALSRCVSQLRKLLGDEEHAVIETLPKVGYRLVAPVRPAHAGDSHAGDSLARYAGAPGGLADGRAPGVGEVTLSVAPRPGAPAPARRARLLPAALAVAGLSAAALAVAALAARGGAPALLPVAPLTSTRGTEVGAAPSPDGSRVAFVATSAAGGERRSDLYVQVLGAGAALRLTDDPASDVAPAWSPDGRAIAFLRCARPREACEVRSVSALGGDERRLAEAPAAPGAGLAWSPDGRTLAYASRGPRGGGADGRPVGLRLLDLATGRSRPLTAPPPGASDGRPRFSPDGRRVAFVRASGPGLSDLYVVPAAGGDARALTRDGRALAGHTWTADGRSVVFSSDRNGLYQLWRVPAGGGAPEVLAGVPTRDPGGPAVAAGGRLVFEEWDFETDVWRAAPGAAAAPLAASTARDMQPHAAPDGRLAFASDRSGTWEIWTSRPDGSAPSRLTRFERAAALHPRWSPDGRRVAFELRAGGRAAVYVVAADGGTPRAVTPEGADAVVPRWSRDGRALYVSARHGGRWEAWRVPLAGGALVRVTDAGGYAAEELPDGRLVYARFGAGGLFVRAPGGPERPLADLASADAASWWVDGDAVVLPVHDDAGPGVRLVRLDPRTGRREGIDLDLDGFGGGEGGLTPLPGGGVAYTRVGRVEADLVVAEGFR